MVTADPWNNPGKQQGPPDLDEVLKKIGDWLNQLLSGGGGKRRNTAPPLQRDDDEKDGGDFNYRYAMFILAAVLVVALLSWGIAGMHVIKEAEQGVVLRFGKYARTLNPGFNWAPKFIDEITVIDVSRVRFAAIGFRRQGNTTVSLPNESLMLTADENIVDIQFAIQYVIKNSKDFYFAGAQPGTCLTTSNRKRCA